MPHLIAIEYSEAQRRQLSEKLRELTKNGWAINGRLDAQNFETWGKLFENTINPGLFVQREVIAIENAETLGEFPDDLKQFLEDDKADTIIILIFNTDAKNLKAIKDSTTLIKPEPQIAPWDRPKWLIALAKESKFTLSYDAAQLLTDSIESQEELRAEINKLALYGEGRKITLDDVENLSFDEGGRALTIFIDGLCMNNHNDVARALKYLRDKPLLPTLAGITNRLRIALMLSCFRNANEVIRVLNVKNYPVKFARAALKNFGADKIKNFMAQSARLSFLEKTNRAESWEGFELIIWELMAKI